ncbi:MAG: tRNA (adenosine(37)-N6)-threonylcarbamoyltransferase complex dimerization subunit type 1 TsaB [Gammaproteobacteria bacterium]
MKLLAVETSTDACSAALLLDGEILERYRIAPREHTRLILPMIESLMDEAGIGVDALDALAFGCGPGSFTGVRIATGVVHGIALGADLPIARVSTLAAMAQSCFDRSGYDFAYSALDARMNEVYWGVYRRGSDGIAHLIGRESVGRAENVSFPENKGFAVGPGWKAYEETLCRRLGDRVLGCDPDLLPTAAAVAKIGAIHFLQGQAVQVERAMPVYLRDNVVKNR